MLENDVRYARNRHGRDNLQRGRRPEQWLDGPLVSKRFLNLGRVFP